MDRVTVAHLAAVAFVQGLCFVFFGLTERAALPKIVPAALLPTATAHNEARSRAASLAGPPLGGMLFGIGRAVPFLADALSYAVACIGLLFIRSDLQNRSTAPSESLWRAAIAGLRWISEVDAEVIRHIEEHGLGRLVHCDGGPGPEELNMSVRATRAGDTVVSGARFFAPDWENH
ncbi:MFS transporter [Streptomyces sp. DT193]|uniref:MFS transporter n=1 Tax=Streptomyces sp. DT193 TaxID=3393418 RepID=UPI003CEE548D